MDKQKLDDLLQFARDLLLSDDIAPLSMELGTKLADRCDSAGQLISALSVQFATSLLAIAETPQQLCSALTLSAMLVNHLAGDSLQQLKIATPPSPTVH